MPRAALIALAALALAATLGAPMAAPGIEAVSLEHGRGRGPDAPASDAWTQRLPRVAGAARPRVERPAVAEPVTEPVLAPSQAEGPPRLLAALERAARQSRRSPRAPPAPRS